jgi:hypothetical protein
MAKFQVGDKVRGIGINSRAVYQGVVVSTRATVHGADAMIKVTKVEQGFGQPVGSEANISNVERIEEMTYVKNLVGPKPEPVQEPKHPTPWTFKGRDVLDANGKVIFRIQVRGMYNNNNNDVPMADAYELATIVARSVNAKFGKKAEDSPSPF